MNSVIINEGQFLPQDDEWVARHLVQYFNASQLKWRFVSTVYICLTRSSTGLSVSLLVVINIWCVATAEWYKCLCHLCCLQIITQLELARGVFFVVVVCVCVLKLLVYVGSLLFCLVWRRSFLYTAETAPTTEFHLALKSRFLSERKD